jgi:sec-independent protein translocase protein TatC
MGVDKSKPVQNKTATIAEHIQELRMRIAWVVALLLIASCAGYFIRDTLISLLQRPLNEDIFYTTPAGAFSFVIKLCTTFGLIVALPVVIYQMFSFFLPLLGPIKRRHLLTYVSWSVLMAASGILFAYTVSLPAALNFLTNFGREVNIKSLITANEYFNFVLTYLAGFAVLFQVPLIILLINKIKPMSPKKLFGATKYVVLVSFIISAIITPTPDPFNQTIMAAPVVLLYIATATSIAILSLIKKRSLNKSSLQRPEASQSHEIPSYVYEAVKTEVTEVKQNIRPILTEKPQPRLMSDFIRIPNGEVKA